MFVIKYIHGGSMFDILIIGGGPAGITAGIYAKRANKRIAIIEKLVPGGQVALIGEIENYPGLGKISGDVLSTKFYNHACSLGVEFIFDEAINYSLRGKIKKVFCKNGVYEAYSVIFALGSASKELNVDGEKRLFGKGVSYCAMCDGNFYKGQDVAVVGSGDSAVSNALYLSNICKRVHLFMKENNKLKVYKEENLKNIKNLSIYKGMEITKISGKDRVTGIEYLDNGKEKKCRVQGIFVAVGRIPDTTSLKGKLKLDKKGYIIADNVKTNIDGVFACGDVVEGALKQIVVASGMGALATTEAINYLSEKI